MATALQREAKRVYNKARYVLKKDEIRAASLRRYHLTKGSLTTDQKQAKLAATRRWRSRNIERERIRERRNRQQAFLKDPKRILTINRNWAHNNRDAIRARDLKRRALLQGASVNLRQIREWIRVVKSKEFFTCYYCDERFRTENVHFDHVVALAKGGPHSVENLCTSCPRCNLSKQDKQVSAWVRIGQQTLSL